jgi:prepilin-type N-terminal cleavage/methylation domain-containing protein
LGITDLTITKKRFAGFTLVELLIVIVVIGILAAVSIISYGTWKTSTLTAQLKSDLNGAATAMENARTFSNAYPTSVPATFVASTGVTISGGGSTDGKTFCIEAASLQNASLIYYINSTAGKNGAQAGTCAGSSPSTPLPSVPTGIVINSSTNTSITLSWSASSNTPTSYTAQCASDAGYTLGIQQSTVSGGTLTATISGLAQGTTFFCHVNATNANGTSAWSSTTSSTTNLTVTGLTATVLTTSSITVNWTATTGATSYITQQANDAGFVSGVVSTIQGTNTYVATGLSLGVTYYFRVAAINSSSSQGPWSTSVSQATH